MIEILERLTPRFYRSANRLGKLLLLLNAVILVSCRLALPVMLPSGDEPEQRDAVVAVAVDEDTAREAGIPSAKATRLDEVAAVLPASTATAVPTETPTDTPEPSSTSTTVPTATSPPTSTFTPRPTNTPPPTNTLPPPTSTLIPTPLPPTVTATRPAETAVVTSIIDGDTIQVEMGGQTYTVRYIGIDAPESNEPCFQDAAYANSGLVTGQTVRLVKDVSETDRYDRLLRYVYVGDVFINAELVRLGWAIPSRYPPDTALAANLERAQIGAPVRSCAVVQATARPPTAPQPTAQPTAASPSPTELPPTIAPEPTALPAASSTDVKITGVNYDGVVARVESDEFAVITNTGSGVINLGGWRLNAGDPGQDFGFPSFDLQPGQSCRVYTNEYHPESCGFSFGNGRAIWNNGGDCGMLFDNTGVMVSQYCY